METKINLELKHFCSDFEPVRKLVQEFGAQKEEPVAQKDYFFFLPQREGGVQPRLKLRTENNTQTLIYYHRADFVEGESTPASVDLYNVTDKKLSPFLEKVLGVGGIVEKVWERWHKDNIVFNFDEVKSAGKIFEIEITTTDAGRTRDEKTFAELQEKFAPYLGEVVKGSNIDLLKATQ